MEQKTYQDKLILELRRKYRQKYYIYDITTRCIGAECVHEYKLRRKEGLQTLTIEHQGTAGCSFEAQVIGVQKDTVHKETDSARQNPDHKCRII